MSAISVCIWLQSYRERDAPSIEEIFAMSDDQLFSNFTDLNLYCIKGALALVVLVSFSGYVC